MIRHKLVLVACCALLGLGLYQPAHGQATPNATPASNPGVMTVLVEQPPTDLDPASSYDENSNIPMRGLYEGLVTLDGAALDKTVPALANKIDNQDNKTPCSPSTCSRASSSMMARHLTPALPNLA